jgi:hypothetical protein
MKCIQAMLLGLLLLPCSAADKAKKQEQALSQNTVSAHSIDEVIANTNPVPLAPGKKVKRSLTLKSPVLETEGRRVVYDLYSISGRASQGFQLTIWSYCKCFGFDKTIIVPKIVVMSNGNALPAEIKTTEKPAAGITPLHHETTLTGAFDSDGTVYVLLYGDTGDVGSTVTIADGGSVYSTASGSTINIGSFDITKSPIGNIAIELKAN